MSKFSTIAMMARAAQAAPAPAAPKVIWEKERGYTAPSGTRVSQREKARVGFRVVHVAAYRTTDGVWGVFAGDDSEFLGQHVRSNSQAEFECSGGPAARARIKALKAELEARIIKAYRRVPRAEREAYEAAYAAYKATHGLSCNDIPDEDVEGLAARRAEIEAADARLVEAVRAYWKIEDGRGAGRWTSYKVRADEGRGPADHAIGPAAAGDQL